MGICNDCGGEIEFRYIGGRRIPIHSDGGCRAYSSNQKKRFVTPEYRVHSGFTHDSFVNPNARCPVCGESVFFYKSPYGGRVYFDELGPPWPKHPCTDSDNEGKQGSRQSSFSSSPIKRTYVWQGEEWIPFICHTLISTSSCVELRGFMGRQGASLALFTDNVGVEFEHLPLLVKPVPHLSKHFQLSTFLIKQEEEDIFTTVILSAFSDVFEYARSKKTDAKAKSLSSHRTQPRKKEQKEQPQKDQTFISNNGSKPKAQTDTAFAVAWRKAQEKHSY